jgi:ribonuclease D
MAAHEIIREPQAFRAAIAAWRHERRLWLDTEVADWFTKAPRLSLLQIRDADGRTWIVDVLDAEMRRVLDEEFIPQVMANDLIEKWAHYARFERRFLGGERAANLNCTFELARSIPYYRLPLASLSLAALEHDPVICDHAHASFRHAEVLALLGEPRRATAPAVHPSRAAQERGHLRMTEFGSS